MFDAFGGCGPGPVHTGLVVIVNGDVEVSVRHVEILSSVLYTKLFFDAFVSSDDLGFAGAESCLFLADGHPRDGATGPVDEKTGKGAKFEKFEGSTILDGIPKLTAQAYIAKGGEIV